MNIGCYNGYLYRESIHSTYNKRIYKIKTEISEIGFIDFLNDIVFNKYFYTFVDDKCDKIEFVSFYDAVGFLTKIIVFVNEKIYFSFLLDTRFEDESYDDIFKYLKNKCSTVFDHSSVERHLEIHFLINYKFLDAVDFKSSGLDFLGVYSGYRYFTKRQNEILAMAESTDDIKNDLLSNVIDEEEKKRLEKIYLDMEFKEI